LPIDARLIAATNRDLEEAIKRGTFRRDLFYRLNVIAIHLPPLRERTEDIPVLADTFLLRACERHGCEPKRFSQGALDALIVYHWPGNVRELENAIERAVILSTSDVVDRAALPDRITERRAESIVDDRPGPNPTLDTVERAYIMWVLQGEGGNKTRAAEVLGIDPSTLHRKLSRFGVES